MPPDSVGMLPAGPPPPVLEVAVAVGRASVGVAVAVATPAGVFVIVGVAVGVAVREGVRLGVRVGPPGVMVGVNVGVGVGVRVTPNGRHCENSDVLLLGSVAVAVMTDPAETVTGSVTLNVAMQDGPIEGVATPRNVIPSPKSLGGAALQEGLEKNSIR